MKKDIFEDLFLTKEEELRYKLEKLADKFILKPEDMLRQLAFDCYEAIYNAKKRIRIYKQYKLSLDNKEKETSRSENKNIS